MEPMHITKGDGERLHFPNLLDMTILIPGSATDGTFSIFEDAVPPNVGPPRHIHKKQDEVFFVLEGSFEFEVDGTIISAGAGDVAFAPRGTIHAFKNVGTTTGRLRYIFMPAGDAEDMFRAICDSAKSESLTPERMAKIAEPFDQEIIGPPL